MREQRGSLRTRGATGPLLVVVGYNMLHMNKTTLLVASFIIFSLSSIGYFVYVLFAPAPASVVPTPPPLIVPTEPIQPVDTAAESFLQQAGVQPLGDGIYSLEAQLIAEDKGFSMIYSAEHNSYIVAITEAPLGANRQAAEKYLLTLLALDEASACQRNISVGVPAGVSPLYAGRELGLSFCPGAVALP